MSRMPPRHSANVDLVDSKRERVAKMQFSGILPEQAVNTAKLLVKLSVDRKMGLKHCGYMNVKDEVQESPAITPKLAEAVNSTQGSKSQQTNEFDVNLKSQSTEGTPSSSGCQCQICRRPREREEPYISSPSQLKENPEQNKRKRVEDFKTEPEECPIPKRTRAGCVTTSELCETPLGVSQFELFKKVVEEARSSLTVLLNSLDRFDFEEWRLRIEEQRLLAEERCATALEKIAQGSLGLSANLFLQKKN